jgi:hypothetical protein
MARSARIFIRDNSLSIILFGLFLIFLAGQAISGHIHNNDELVTHGAAAIPFLEYLRSGEFIESVFENWESEFLQMGALVVFTIFLRQRGSADSKKLHGKGAVDTSSRYSIIHAGNWHTRGKAIKDAIHGNSLSLALFGLFLMSFAFHALGGASAHNEEAQLHGEPQVSVLSYLATSQFWFESFQNWQSEFLAVGLLLILSVFLRQRGSPESKPVSAPNDKTGD